MNKKIYLIANWKMQLSNDEAVALALEIKKQFNNLISKQLEVVLCPSFTALAKVEEVIKKTGVKLGAQDVFYQAAGSYTGEISPENLKELNVEYVIIGHSERRKYLKETDEEINRKIKIALENNLIPILCVGETFEQRQEGKTDLVIDNQLSKDLQGIELAEDSKLIIAYEPVWVIGSGQAVKAEDAEHISQVAKHNLLNFFSQEIIEKNTSVIYGGSVDVENVKDFIKPGIIDGVLVGGASLTSEKFIPLINKL